MNGLIEGAEGRRVSGIAEGVLIVGIVAWVAVVDVGLPALVVFALGRAIGVW